MINKSIASISDDEWEIAKIMILAGVLYIDDDDILRDTMEKVRRNFLETYLDGDENAETNNN